VFTEAGNRPAPNSRHDRAPCRNGCQEQSVPIRLTRRQVESNQGPFRVIRVGSGTSATCPVTGECRKCECQRRRRYRATFGSDEIDGSTAVAACSPRHAKPDVPFVDGQAVVDSGPIARFAINADEPREPAANAGADLQRWSRVAHG
jgi:hypothetical protein